MKRALLVALLLHGCGGGGGGSSPAPVPHRAGIHFGYFADTCSSDAPADFQMIAGWCPSMSMVEEATQAKARGQKIVLLPPDDSESTLRSILDSFRQANVLGFLLAIYRDEPDVWGMNDAQVAYLTAMWRRVASEYPEIQNVRLWSIYGSAGRAGVQYWDAVGHDNYGSGPQLQIVNAGQGQILIPGGAAPWREDPRAFLHAAYQTTNVVAVMPFIWAWPGVGHEGDGISGSFIEAKYRAAGCEVLDC